MLGLATLGLIGVAREAPPKRSYLGPFLVVFLTGTVLITGTLDMPHFGDPEAPIHPHVAPRYINDSGREIGVPNIVTAVLASYRGYDTLGEVAVIFTAGIGVMFLLGRRREDEDMGDAESGEDEGGRA